MDSTTHVALVSRLWNSPIITVDVTPESSRCPACGHGGAISISCPMPAFMDAVAAEAMPPRLEGVLAVLGEPFIASIVAQIGNPTLLVTKEQLRTKLAAAVRASLLALPADTLVPAPNLRSAADAVVAGMKQETVRVVK